MLFCHDVAQAFLVRQW